MSTPPISQGPAGNDDAYLAGLESKEGGNSYVDVDTDGTLPPPASNDAGGGDSGNDGYEHPTKLWQLLELIWTTHRGYPRGAPQFRQHRYNWPVIGFERPKREVLITI